MPIDTNELISFIFLNLLLFFMALNFKTFKRVIGWKIFLAAFSFFLAHSYFTLLEEFIMPNALDIVEHTCRLIAAILFALWARRYYLHRCQQRASS